MEARGVKVEVPTGNLGPERLRVPSVQAATPVLDRVVDGSQPGVEACSQVGAPALQGRLAGGVGGELPDLVQEVPDLGPERLEFTVVDWMTGGFV